MPNRRHLILTGSHQGAPFMLRRIIIGVLVIAAGAAVAARADARQRRQIDATPFSHAPCSVLDYRPCTPSFCSVFNRGPCIPEIDYPYGENLQLTVQSVPSQDDAAKYVKPDHDLDNLGDLFAQLRSCEEIPQRKLDRKMFTNATRELHRQQRVPTRFEEVVGCRDLAHSERLLP